MKKPNPSVAIRHSVETHRVRKRGCARRYSGAATAAHREVPWFSRPPKPSFYPAPASSVSALKAAFVRDGATLGLPTPAAQEAGWLRSILSFFHRLFG